MIRTKSTAAQARVQHEKDLLQRDHRRGEHAETPQIKCPACRSEGRFSA